MLCLFQIELVRFFSSDANIIALTELFCADPVHSPNNCQVILFSFHRGYFSSFIFFLVFAFLKEQRLSNFIASALVEAVTEEKADVLKTLLRMWQVDIESESFEKPKCVYMPFSYQLFISMINNRVLAES